MRGGDGLYIDPGFAGDVGCRHLLWWYIHRARNHNAPPNSQDVRLATDNAADLLRRANREGCTLLLGTCRVDRVGPVMAAVVVREGIAAVVVDLECIVGGAVVVVLVVVAIALTWVVVVVFGVVAIA